MFPVICKIGPFSIYSYGLMLVLAFFISSALAVRAAEKQDILPDLIFNLLFGVFIFGILGARIFYIIENAGYYFRNPLEIIMFQHGGLSWFGGLILGVAYGVIYLRKKKTGILKTLDLIIPYIALAQAIGRIGCLLNGCCYGRASEYGIYFPQYNAVLIPTQAYSSLIMVFIFVILRLMQRMRLPTGKIFFAYLFLYSIKRFFIEFLRDDNPLVFHGLTLFQLLSVAMFMAAVIGLFKCKAQSGKYKTKV